MCGEADVPVAVKARYALAAIRIVNGALALVAPSFIIKRFGEDPATSAAAVCTGCGCSACVPCSSAPT